MKRPKKYRLDLPSPIGNKGYVLCVAKTLEYYKPSDIDPLLDELEQLRADKICINTIPNSSNDFSFFNQSKLDCSKITTLEEVKLILNGLDLHINFDSTNYEKLKHLIVNR